jgi:Glycosyltransferase family 25 (LPS biosynthesis protein)
MNKFFDEVIVIGLERCQNRIDMVESQLKEINKHTYLKYRIFPAFDGKQILNPSMKTMTRAPLKAFANFNPNRPKFLPGMLCCGLSHIAVLKYAKMMNLEAVLILEDDVILSPDFADRLKLLEEAPDDAQIIYLGAIVTSDHLSKKYKVSEHVWNAQKMNLYATHSYIATYKGYDAIIKKMMECEDTCDSLLVDGLQKQEIKGYALLPFCTYQVEGTSEIDFKRKSLNYTKTLYSPDADFDHIGGYDRKTKLNIRDIKSEYSYEEIITPKLLF